MFSTLGGNIQKVRQNGVYELISEVYTQNNLEISLFPKVLSGVLFNSSLANGDKSPSYKICQMHTQSSQLACPTWHVTKTPYGQWTTQKINT